MSLTIKTHMSNYIIKNIQQGITANGRFPDTINVEVEFQYELGKSVFISMMEMKGYPSVFKTDESVFPKFMNRGAECRDMWARPLVSLKSPSAMWNSPGSRARPLTIPQNHRY